MAGTTITPSNTTHATVDVPLANEVADATWLKAHTFQHLADLAKYAYEQIAVKIAAMLAGDVAIGGGLVVVDHVTTPVLASTGIEIVVADDVALADTAKFYGGRRIDTAITISSWPGTPPTATHEIADGNVIRTVVGAVVADLRLSRTGVVEGDWVRITLGPVGALDVYDDDAASPMVSMTVAGQQLYFTYYTDSGWQLA